MVQRREASTWRVLMISGRKPCGQMEGREVQDKSKMEEAEKGACKGRGEPLEWRILRKDKTFPLRKWSEHCWAGLCLRSENTVCSKTSGQAGKQKKTR